MGAGNANTGTNLAESVPVPVDPGTVGATPSSTPPAVRFTDVTRAAGINFRHVAGAHGDKFLPETMGGGVAVLDYDKNGDQELLLGNSSHWPGHAPAGKPGAGHAFAGQAGGGEHQAGHAKSDSGKDVASRALT